MSILALDLGTHTGWAMSDVDCKAILVSGVWTLGGNARVSKQYPGLRFYELYASLMGARQGSDGELRIAYYEDVHPAIHRGADATRIYFGLRGTFLTWAHSNDIETVGIGPGTIKKHATGYGKAHKEDMVKAARKMCPGVDIKDHNEADAVCLLSYAFAQTKEAQDGD